MSKTQELKGITEQSFEDALREWLREMLAVAATGANAANLAEALEATIIHTAAGTGQTATLTELLRRHAVPLSTLDASHEESVFMLVDSAESSQRYFVRVLAKHAEDRAHISKWIEALSPEHVPPRAVVEQARGNAELRARFLEEFESVSSSELAEIVSSRSANRSALAYNWRTHGRAFAVQVGRDYRYPLFQFDLETGQPRPPMTEILAMLREAGLDGWQLALWFAGPLASLDGRRPVDLLPAQPELVASAARAVAEIPE